MNFLFLPISNHIVIYYILCVVLWHSMVHIWTVRFVYYFTLGRIPIFQHNIILNILIIHFG